MSKLTEILTAIDELQMQIPEGKYLELMNMLKDQHAHEEGMLPCEYATKLCEIVVNSRALITRMRQELILKKTQWNKVDLIKDCLLLLVREQQEDEPRILNMDRQFWNKIRATRGVGATTINKIMGHPYIEYIQAHSADNAAPIALKSLPYICATCTNYTEFTPITYTTIRKIMGQPGLNIGAFNIFDFEDATKYDPIAPLPNP